MQDVLWVLADPWFTVGCAGLLGSVLYLMVVHYDKARPVCLTVDSPSLTTRHVTLFGHDVTLWPAWARLLVLALLVFVFYLLYGYVQEAIFRLPGFKPFGWYLTLMQFAFYSGLSGMERVFTGQHMSRKGLPAYHFPDSRVDVLSISTVHSCDHGSFQCFTGIFELPDSSNIQVLQTHSGYDWQCANSSRCMIGTWNFIKWYKIYGVTDSIYLNLFIDYEMPRNMILDHHFISLSLPLTFLIAGKKYGCLDFLSASLMSTGLILFSLADVQVLPNFNLNGYLMILGALCADAVIGNVQEKAMKSHHANNSEMIFFSYSIGFIYILCGMLLSGDLLSAIRFCAKHPYETYGYAAVFSVTGFLGVNVVLTLVTSFGAFIAVTVTTCRKAITICLSFLLFSKPFTMQYVWSGLLVLLGIYVSVYSKNRDKWNPYFIAQLQGILTWWHKYNLKSFSRNDYLDV